MRQSRLQYKAQAMRLEKIIYGVEAILVYVAALFTSALLPSLLMQYVFKSANPFEAPKIIEYIPIAAFALATIYFVYATVKVLERAAKIKRLDKEMESMMGDCCGGDCGDLSELKELEMLAEKAIKSAKKPAKRKTSKKTSKKK